jgi:hypothetical protein
LSTGSYFVRVLISSAVCVAVIALVLWAIFILVPGIPAQSVRKAEALKVFDGLALIGGLLAMVVLPPVIVRRRSALIGALFTVPVYIGALFISLMYMPYWQAWWHCGHQPIIQVGFAAADTYERPGDPTYSPGLFNDGYVCSEAEARAHGFQRSSLDP